MTNELALFTGAGGGLLASKLLGWRTVAAVEWDPFCRSVIFARQADGDLDAFPVWDDVQTFDGRPWRGHVDLVTGGFPCQPFSSAGKQLGADDPRNMWPATARILREVGPRRAFLENVPGLLASGYFGTVLGDLAGMGYRVAWGVLGASTVGARHHRRRLWILADDATRGQGDPADPERQDDKGGNRRRVREPARSSSGNLLGDSEGTDRPGAASAGPLWRSEPHVGRVVDGVAPRMDQPRIAALGNGQVPICAAVAYSLLCQAIGVED